MHWCKCITQHWIDSSCSGLVVHALPAIIEDSTKSWKPHSSNQVSAKDQQTLTWSLWCQRHGQQKSKVQPNFGKFWINLLHRAKWQLHKNFSVPSRNGIASKPNLQQIKWSTANQCQNQRLHLAQACFKRWQKHVRDTLSQAFVFTFSHLSVPPIQALSVCIVCYTIGSKSFIHLDWKLIALQEVLWCCNCKACGVNFELTSQKTIFWETRPLSSTVWIRSTHSCSSHAKQL